MSASEDDRRVHSRLQTQLEVEVISEDSQRTAELRDLSQGGACILLAGGELARGQILQVLLPASTGTVGINASVVRSTPIRDGALTALRFTDVDAIQLAAVDVLIGELLVIGGGGIREHPRVSRRLKVPVEGAAEMIAVVENISLGGVAMKVEAPLEVGEKILLVLPDDEGDDLLTMKACVTNQRVHEADAETTWVVGLTFNDLSKHRRVLLDALLVALLSDA